MAIGCELFLGGPILLAATCMRWRLRRDGIGRVGLGAGAIAYGSAVAAVNGLRTLKSKSTV